MKPEPATYAQLHRWCLRISAVLQDNRSFGLQRAEDADGDELHVVRRVDILL